MDVGDVLEAKIDRQASTLADLVLVTEDALVRDAISLMREKDVSQLLVTVTAELPLAAKEVSGSLSELGVLEATTRDPSVLDLTGERDRRPRNADGRRGRERQRADAASEHDGGRARARRWTPGRGAHAQ